jgi:hypothetical protein
LDDSGDSARPFPTLPILSSAPQKRRDSERYGALFYLGIGGLVFMVGLVAWFVHGLWANREVFSDVYIVHDRSRPAGQRIEAALRLAQGSQLGDAQLMEISLRRDVPDRARYVLAEAVSTDAVERDPRGFALTVARSPGWPDWLRLLLARRLAYGASGGLEIPREALEELARHSDAMIRLWATYSLAAQDRSDARVRQALENAAHGPAPDDELASMLLEALDAQEPQRSLILDRASLWLRDHHPQAKRIWDNQPDRAS